GGGPARLAASGRFDPESALRDRGMRPLRVQSRRCGARSIPGGVVGVPDVGGDRHLVRPPPAGAGRIWRPMKYLVVNADDFGACAGVNRGIVEANRHGIVTSASLMVEMPGSEEAAAMTQECPAL